MKKFVGSLMLVLAAIGTLATSILAAGTVNNDLGDLIRQWGVPDLSNQPFSLFVSLVGGYALLFLTWNLRYRQHRWERVIERENKALVFDLPTLRANIARTCVIPMVFVLMGIAGGLLAHSGCFTADKPNYCYDLHQHDMCLEPGTCTDVQVFDDAQKKNLNWTGTTIRSVTTVTFGFQQVVLGLLLASAALALGYGVLWTIVMAVVLLCEGVRRTGSWLYRISPIKVRL